MSSPSTPDPEPARGQPGAGSEPEVARERDVNGLADDTGAGVDGAAAADGPARPPTFTERHRTVLGVLAIVVSLAVAAFFAIVGPASEPPAGITGVVVRWGAPLCWLLLAVVFATWTMRMKPQITQRLSFVVLGCYLLYMVSRFI